MITNDELLAFLKKNPIGVGCGILILALGGWTYYRSGDIPAAEELLAQKTAEANRYEANIANAKDLNDQLDALVAANKEIESRLIRANQLGINSQFFFTLESETGVKLLEPGRPGTVPRGLKTAFAPVPFSVSAQGTLAQLLQFLYHLEGGARYTRVLSASLVSTGGGANRSDQLTLSLYIEQLGLP